MPVRKIIETGTQTLTSIVTTSNGASISLNGAEVFSAQCNVTVGTPANKTFLAAAVNTGTEQITITSHGFTTGVVVQISNGTTLPTGVTALTSYYIIVIDANTIQLATSLANALAGTPLNITGQGSGTNTVNVQAISGATIQLQSSNDNSIWNNVGTTVSIIQTGSLWLSIDNPEGQYMRIQFTLATGLVSSSNVFTVKGAD